MSEINPNHPTTAAARDQWHKLCALVLHKLGGEAVITSEDITDLGEEFARGGGPAIVMRETHRGIELSLISMEKAEDLARQHGGLPS
ncbi:hypothetical protein [Ralstonia holmesii]|uniref:hypothetical protein n=1 Tax=Ralstonia holmesii TaxID=3058602 RepID=UPI0028F65165|nr:hypothetical protein [Ralstonia sp. LMG 32967]CAJ0698738.1 hypothetical protein R11007_02873 [Ralstonia sp. LMG 32967]